MDNKHPSAPGAYAPNFPPQNTNAQGYAQPPYVNQAHCFQKRFEYVLIQFCQNLAGLRQHVCANRTANAK